MHAESTKRSCKNQSWGKETVQRKIVFSKVIVTPEGHLLERGGSRLQSILGEHLCKRIAQKIASVCPVEPFSEKTIEEKDLLF